MNYRSFAIASLAHPWLSSWLASSIPYENRQRNICANPLCLYLLCLQLHMLLSPESSLDLRICLKYLLSCHHRLSLWRHLTLFDPFFDLKLLFFLYQHSLLCAAPLLYQNRHTLILKTDIMMLNELSGRIVFLNTFLCLYQGCEWNDKSVNRERESRTRIGSDANFFWDSLSNLEIDDNFGISNNLGLGLAANISTALALQPDRDREIEII